MYGRDDVVLEYQVSSDLPHLRTDIYLPKLNLCIEVEGSSHYLADGKTLTASTVYRHGILRDLGYSSLSVSHFDWNNLKGLGAKQKYLADGIQIESRIDGKRKDPIN